MFTILSLIEVLNPTFFMGTLNLFLLFYVYFFRLLPHLLIPSVFNFTVRASPLLLREVSEGFLVQRCVLGHDACSFYVGTNHTAHLF
jgi:hypothetical protein